MPDNSIDLLCTDPPYGISFMGKSWDKALPNIEIWKECLRVLKPGAFAFVMCIPRSDCQSRMAILLEDAGFRIDFTPMYWAFASGFPKAQNIGKAVDKRWKKRTEYDELANYLKIARGKIGLSQKDIAKHFPSKTGGLTGCVWNWENAKNVPTQEQWTFLKNLLQLDNQFDWLIEQETKRYEEAEREIIYSKGAGRKRQNESYSNGLPIKEDATLPATPQAKALDGSFAGFQPKPALEVILVAMKPLSEKTYVDQAMKNGKGCTWLDDCRVPYESDGDKRSIDAKSTKDRAWRLENGKKKGDIDYGEYADELQYSRPANLSGRFPANLLVSETILGDDFSRFFSLDSWWEKKLSELPESGQRTFPFLIVPKASKSEKNKGCETILPKHAVGNKWTENDYLKGDGEKTSIPHSNNHPTCKPLKLISYLITLGSREGDTILDPFLGSGTTAIACKPLNRACIGIEINKDYCEIATARCNSILPLEVPKPRHTHSWGPDIDSRSSYVYGNNP